MFECDFWAGNVPIIRKVIAVLFVSDTFECTEE